MSIIKNLEKGLYEFTNYFKVSAVTDVPDPEVKRVTPFRGAITNLGDLIEAEYINTVAQAGVWWIKFLGMRSLLLILLLSRLWLMGLNLRLSSPLQMLVAQ